MDENFKIQFITQALNGAQVTTSQNKTTKLRDISPLVPLPTISFSRSKSAYIHLFLIARVRTIKFQTGLVLESTHILGADCSLTRRVCACYQKSSTIDIFLWKLMAYELNIWMVSIIDIYFVMARLHWENGYGIFGNSYSVLLGWSPQKYIAIVAPPIMKINTSSDMGLDHENEKIQIKKIMNTPSPTR